MASTAPRRLGYVPALDGLRGISLPGTIFTHYLGALAGQPGAGSWLHDAAPFTLNIEMFFVLSGALITALLVQEQARTDHISLASFYRRRFRRLGPALLAVVAVLLVAQVFIKGGLPPLGTHWHITVICVLLFVGNWRYVATQDANSLGWLGPTWTLGIEEQFYATWPFTLRWALRRGARRTELLAGLAIVCVAMIGIGAAIEHGHITHADGVALPLWSTPVQAPAILVGCALGLELASNPDGRLARLLRPQPVGIIGLLGIAGMSELITRAWANTEIYGGYALYALVASLLIGHCMVVGREGRGLVRVLAWRPFVIIGQVSYEAYLIHLCVIFEVLRLFPHMHALPMIGLDSLLIAVISAAFYYGVGRPIRRHGWGVLIGRSSRRVMPDPAALG